MLDAPELLSRVSQVLELPGVPGGTRVGLTGAGYADTRPTAGALVGFFREGIRVTMEALGRRFGAGPAAPGP